MTATMLTTRPAEDAAADAGPFLYRAYGQTIRSDIPLPELDPAPGGPADVTIRLGRIDRPSPAFVDGVHFTFGARDHYVAWEAVGGFLISDGADVTIDPNPDVDATLIAFPLLGPVMALLLHQRRKLVLHASAVDVGGKAVVFLGDKGAGKSTTAGLMLKAGHTLVSDDVVAFDFAGQEPGILPAFPQLKLADDAAGALSLRDAWVRPGAHPAIPKRQHRLAHALPHEPVPPARIYVLERGEEAVITPLHAMQALGALMRFSFVTRFGPAVLEGEGRATYFRQCALVANEIGVHRLAVPRGLDRAGAVVSLIERHVAAFGQDEGQANEV